MVVRVQKQSSLRQINVVQQAVLSTGKHELWLHEWEQTNRRESKDTQHQNM